MKDQRGACSGRPTEGESATLNDRLESDDGTESANRWDEIKPEFMRLYIHEGKSLSKVQEELREEHGFTARCVRYVVACPIIC